LDTAYHAKQTVFFASKLNRRRTPISLQDKAWFSDSCSDQWSSWFRHF